MNGSARTTLGDADRLEIQELLARYNQTIDTGQVAAWVEVFTEDGSFTNRSGRSWVGADALTEFARERAGKPELRPLQHWIGNIVITPTEQGAESRCYCQLIEQGAEGVIVRSMSFFTDQLRRKDGRWRLHSRTVSAWPLT